MGTRKDTRHRRPCNSCNPGAGNAALLGHTNTTQVPRRFPRGSIVVAPPVVCAPLTANRRHRFSHVYFFPPPQAEPDTFASTGSDRSIALYDLRRATPTRKLVMQTRCNALAWNPMEPFNFTAANEDCCLYTFDMRKLDSALCVHKVGAKTGNGRGG